MKFLLDENIERRLAVFLKQQGYDIKSVGHDYPKAIRDKEVLALALQEQRILITSDYTDYYDLIFRKHLPHFGIVILRLNDLALPAKQQRVREVIDTQGESLEQTYRVVTPLEIILPSALS
jgi:predicted nuclease of predicted toxin-antitoxin system